MRWFEKKFDVVTQGFGAVILLLCLAAPLESMAGSRPHGGLLRFPDVNETHIVFGYANDLWMVPREGGTATPLANPPGGESRPRFSPDGKTVAFQGNYEGNRDIYTIATDGGVPFRVTYHPAAERLCEWTSDGRLIFSSNGTSHMRRISELKTVGATGGLPEKLPVPYGNWGTISKDGRWLAYTPGTRDHRTWKRYRGGLASDIWLFDLEKKTSKRITKWEGTDTQPMWHGTKIYYLSDRGPAHRINIWSYDTKTKRRAQITHFKDFDIKYAAMGPGPDGDGEIVFQSGADIYLIGLESKQPRRIEVTIPGATAGIRTQVVDVSDSIRSWSISPKAKRVAVTARGDVWTLPAQKGSPRNLSKSSGSAERDVEWSPDGRWLAYLSDQSGEYELYITQSDGKTEPRRLTHDGSSFRFSPTWSPDSKWIAYWEKTGAAFLVNVEDESKVKIDQDPYPGQFPGSALNFSHDSRFITYARSSDEGFSGSVYIYDIEAAKSRKVTSDLFNDAAPVFDRKGDYLFYKTNRHFQPTYSDLDTTFIYRGSQVLVAVPLRSDQESPFAPTSDEESWEDEEDGDEKKDDEGDDGEEDQDGTDSADDDSKSSSAEDDGVSGLWEGSISSGMAEFPPGMNFTLTLHVAADGSVSGSISIIIGSASIDSGTYDKDTGAIDLKLTADDGSVWTASGTILNGSLNVTASNAMGMSVELTGTRISAATNDTDDDGDDTSEDKKKDKKKVKKVEIAWEGFEHRAVQIPVPPGNFGTIAVNDKGHLIYSRFAADGPPSIKIFDMKDEKKEEKDVAKGAGAFMLSADGKHMLVLRAGKAQILKASAGATGKNVPTAGMIARINPREEWRQVFLDAWRQMRDFFYDPNMHGVDWEAMRDHYGAMIDDCATREDLSFVIRELISELNAGHAYYFGPKPTDPGPSLPIGLLGIDFEVVDGAFRISKIYEGGDWDIDARGPLSAPGLDVEIGDFLLEVNGSALDPTQSPWAAFQGLAERAVSITVSKKPVKDDDAREIIVKPITSEANLRYRAWIEKNRRYVAEKTDGRVGYIHVPDTGINGQNNLFRQFFGQLHLDALIIDERWNGGGQIPTRFIELLNRPVMNYFARRDGKDWVWPPDAHHGPKVMLINGHAGSGGDAFPAYFRAAGLGKLIGTRTWGGLIGIAGSPGMIDGSGITLPSFAFYESDGTWGIEGHGVDPDIEVIDDPALMVDGGDPQLDAAIKHILGELRSKAYKPPKRPRYPNRSGMGIAPADK